MIRYILVLLIFLFLMTSSIYGAVASGSFQWGAYGNYSWIPYIMLLGMLSSIVPVFRSKNKNAIGAFLLFFYGYTAALGQMKPVGAEVANSIGWLFEFAAIITGGIVIAAGIALGMSFD